MKVSVSSFISFHLRASRKTHVEIAREVGFSSSNMLSIMKNGTMKIPLDRVPALVESLGISAQSLFVLCVEEYEPGLWRAIQLCLPGAFLSDDDLETLRIVKGKLAHLKALGDRQRLDQHWHARSVLEVVEVRQTCARRRSSAEVRRRL